MKRYFLLFREMFGKPQAIDAVLRQTRSGWQLLSPLNSLSVYDSFYPSTDEIEADLKRLNFVEVPQKAFDAATSEYWRLYAYREYINKSYLKALMDWSGYDGAPEVQTQNPLSPEAEAIIDSATRASVSFGDSRFNDHCLIFPQFGNVVATQDINGQLLPYWDSIATTDIEVPALIDATELERYAPLMARMGKNRSGRMLSYYYED